jgi:hypothetical protein
VNLYNNQNEYHVKQIICDKLVFWGANHYANKLPNVGGWLIWDAARGIRAL